MSSDTYLKIATWNVNSIRVRLQHLETWLQKCSIDIALLQELRCSADEFPYTSLSRMGYQCLVHAQKARNGVAIISRFPIEEKKRWEEARYIEGIVDCGTYSLRVASVYIPNGQSHELPAFQHKLQFLDNLYKHLEDLLKNEEMICIGGDYNVAPEPIDVYNTKKLAGSICYHIEERKRLRALFSLGYYDAFRTIHHSKKEFSWWHYRDGCWKNNHGLRIDSLLLSPQAADCLNDCNIHYQLRAMIRPSDHAPVEAILIK